jgi:uncharacterized protein (DUF736 family)
MSQVEQMAQRPGQKSDTNQPDFVVRAKTGPGRKEWSTIGYAWKRERGEGFSVKLNTMPIGSNWNGVLVLLPPYADDDAGDAPGD